ncbi:hypothetical protein VP01_322g2 [Puccinia sorghi]|uniref:No apical meristem-associated C-terminal domain-containing protein n=1 Tax=Puccinia sorghi TaxID=27349 RepID=A0A0L6UZ22_9BASI|nr:hypothetical protein VP01_322g2 [Puccinia sorghi]
MASRFKPLGRATHNFVFQTGKQANKVNRDVLRDWDVANPPPNAGPNILCDVGILRWATIMVALTCCVDEEERKEEQRGAQQWRMEEARRYEATQEQLAHKRRKQEAARREQEKSRQLFETAMLTLISNIGSK